MKIKGWKLTDGVMEWWREMRRNEIEGKERKKEKEEGRKEKKERKKKEEGRIEWGDKRDQETMNILPRQNKMSKE